MIKVILTVFLLAVMPGMAEEPPYEARFGLIHTGGFIIFLNSKGTLSYNTLTRSEIPADAVDAGKVKCRSCQHGLSVPLTVPSATSRGSTISGAQGDGGFAKALRNLIEEKPDLRGIYDVKIDFHNISILGIYSRQCTEVSARGFK